MCQTVARGPNLAHLAIKFDPPSLLKNMQRIGSGLLIHTMLIVSDLIFRGNIHVILYRRLCVTNAHETML